MNRRGFTIIEIAISLALLIFVTAGASALLIKQSQASVKQTQDRDLEENGRLALLELGRAVRQAGYGIAPIAAFDFDRYSCTAPGTANTCNGGGRDRNDAPDELVVAWRDPQFYRNATAISGAGPWTVTLSAALTAPIASDRIVQMLCGSADPSAYVAVATNASVGDTTLRVRALTNADGYFPQTQPTAACFGFAGVMLIERVRYFVANDTDGVPTLYRDRGRGANEIVNRGIEDLQITYDIGQPPAGSPFSATVGPAGCGTNWTYGLCNLGAPPETATAPDWKADGYDTANRYTGHPANIRTVNIFVVARSIGRTPDLAGSDVPQIANRPARAVDTFRRAVFTVTEQTSNLLARSHFLPLVFANGNVGGG